jgi:hypothetical protein
MSKVETFALHDRVIRSQTPYALVMDSTSVINLMRKNVAIPKIVVAGDVVEDYLQFSLVSKDPTIRHNWQRYSRTTAERHFGGAALAADLLRSCLSPESVASYQLPVSGLRPNPNLVRSYIKLQQFPIQKFQKEEKVFRVEEFIGFADGSGPLAFDIKHPGAKLVVLNDCGNGFRDQESRWPDAIKNNDKPIVILKTSSPIAEGALWRELVRRHNNRLLVVVNADDLRREGGYISRGISWERTALDFAMQVKENPTLREIKRCRNIIVRFGLEGVIHYSNHGTERIRIFYDPDQIEGEYSEQFDGKMYGVGTVLCVSIALNLVGDRFRFPNTRTIEAYIRDGLVAIRRLLRFGFGGDFSDLRIQHEEVFSRSSSSRHLAMSRIPSAVSASMQDARSWSFLKQIAGNRLPSLAETIVIEGKIPPAQFGVPLARFSDLETLDRSEIESYRGIRSLFYEFVSSKDPVRPLSIAVFGQPGSGKSFGITEIAKDLREGTIEHGYVFNLAQFTSIKDLTEALHTVRDVPLRGKVPLVFFDEFDAPFQGQLGWLKYFLAPMQDGKFKDGENMHPIGKAIFVFAGGTSDTFEEFRDKFKSSGDTKLENEAKLPDFISRLRGYINVIGPDPVGARDNQAIIRRAVMLRSLLLRKCRHLIRNGKVEIDEGVLHAFLNTPKYEHGVRSMEALIDMSVLVHKKRFERSALPTKDQLQLHVDSDDFLSLVLDHSRLRRIRTSRRSGRRAKP